MTPHPFQADPDIPADHRGRKTCICGLVGKARDVLLGGAA